MVQHASSSTQGGGSLLVRRGRIVPLGPAHGSHAPASVDPAVAPHGPLPLGSAAADGPVPCRSVEPLDLRIDGGIITAIGPGLPSHGEPELEADGRWVIPGLWDQHVHAAQAAKASAWFDVGGAPTAADAIARVAAHLATLPTPTGAGDAAPVTGFGFRLNAWSDAPSVAALDAVSGPRPVFLISGDAHSGWLNTAAQALLGVGPFAGAVSEGDWFPLFDRLDEVPALRPDAAAFARWLDGAAARGITGLVDMEFHGAFADWPGRVASGLTQVRVRAAVYPHQLAEVLAQGLRTGHPLESSGLVTMGPLKIITDGSLGSGTAWCCSPYAADGAQGAANLTQQDLNDLVASAARHGLDVALHGIGDRACQVALDAFQATGAKGTLEHAQLLRDADVARLARLGVAASVQPLHLLDDRDAVDRLWGDRAGRCYRFRDLLDAGAEVRFGSDAPIAPVDPWGAMAAAVHRSGDDRQAWHPEQALTPREALRCSVGGRRVRVGDLADLVLIGDDPLRSCRTPEEAAAHLRHLPVLATVCAGRLTHLDHAWGVAP